MLMVNLGSRRPRRQRRARAGAVDGNDAQGADRPGDRRARRRAGLFYQQQLVVERGAVPGVVAAVDTDVRAYSTFLPDHGPHFLDVGLSAAMPLPTMATRRPPARSRFSDGSMCAAPVLCRVRVDSPAELETAGS